MQLCIRSETHKRKELYYNLVKVIKFENICKEFTLKICQTCEVQVMFWRAIQQNTTIDFNILNREAEKIIKHANVADAYWEKLSRINPGYYKVIGKYITYLKDVRNNEQKSNFIREKYKESLNRASLSIMEKDNEVLFGEKTAVLHVSGSKENTGKIMQASKSTYDVLGFSNGELKSSSVSKVMPWVLGKNHTALMNNYFKTGKSKLINKEQYTYAQHKSGYCFRVKLMIREMPNLRNDFIQYAGLIVKVVDDYEYILTDAKGVISSMTENLALILGIKQKWIDTGLNVQMFAPDLVTSYSGSEKKYKEAGGKEMVIIVPKGLAESMERIFEDLKCLRSSDAGFVSGNITVYNGVFNQKRKTNMTTDNLRNLEEYKNYEFKTEVKCQMIDMEFTLLDVKTSQEETNTEKIKFCILKIIGLQHNKRENESECNEKDDIDISSEKLDDNKDSVDLNTEERASHKTTKELVTDVLRKMFKMGTEKMQEEISLPQINEINKTKLFIKSHTQKSTTKIYSISEEESELGDKSCTRIKKSSKDASEDSEVSINEENNKNKLLDYQKSYNEASYIFSQNEKSAHELTGFDIIGNQEEEFDFKKIKKNISDDLIDFPDSFTEEDFLFECAKDHEANEFDENSIAFAFPRSRQKTKIIPDKPYLFTEQKPTIEKSKTMRVVEEFSVEIQQNSPCISRSTTNNQIMASEIASKDESGYKKKNARNFKPEAILKLLNAGNAGMKRKLKVFDNPDFDLADPVSPVGYEPTEHEVALKQYFHIRQAKERKVKELDESSNDVKSKEDESANELNANYENDDEGSSGSTSSAGIVNPFYIMRSAVEEKFMPKMLKYLSLCAGLLFLLVIALIALYYFSENNLCDKMQKRLINIRLSEERKTYLYHISIHLHNALAHALANPELDTVDTIMAISAIEMRDAGNMLDSVQSKFIKSSLTINYEEFEQTSPSSIILEYNNYTHHTMNYLANTVSQTILEVSLATFRIYWYISAISSGYLSYLKAEEPVIYIVWRNSLNSVSRALTKSTSSIIDKVVTDKSKQLKLYLVICGLVLGAVFTAMLIFIPVIVWVKKKRDEILLMFLHLPENSIKKYRRKCEQFMQINELQVNSDEELKKYEESSMENNEEEKIVKNKNSKKLALHKQSVTENHNKKKFKKIINSFIGLILKIFFSLLMVNILYMAGYIGSERFLIGVEDYCKEVYYLASRLPASSFLLAIEKNLILYNSTTTVEYVPIASYLSSYESSIYSEHEQLLAFYARNKGRHTAEYVALFELIILSDFCQGDFKDEYGLLMNKTMCSRYNEGIFKHGIYMSMIKCWDHLNKVKNNFFYETRNISQILKLYQDNKINTIYMMQNYYFKTVLDVLIKQMEQDIEEMFDERFYVNSLFCLLILIYVVLLCIIGWKSFLFDLGDELWKGKLFFAMVPAEAIAANEDMRKYLSANSSITLFDTKL